MSSVRARRDPLRAIAFVIAVAALVATVAGLVLVQRLGNTTREALDVTVETADLIADVAGQSASLPDAMAELTRAVNTTLRQVRSLTSTAATTGYELSDALGTNVAQSIEGTARTADRLAGWIELVERFIPGNSNSLAEDLREISDGLEPVPGQLRALGERLREGSDGLTDTIDTLEQLETRLTRLAVDITAASVTVADAPRIAAQIQASARAARDDIDRDLWLLRLLVVAGGTAVGLVALGFANVQRRLALYAPNRDPVAPGAATAKSDTVSETNERKASAVEEEGV